MLNRYFIIIIVLALIVIIVSGCEQTQVKGVRERNKLKSEPEIVVKLGNGEERKMMFEEYITGVVAGEMKKNWPENAYGAQAIIARTFALKYLNDNNTNIISGSYEYAQEYKPENITDTLREAVQKTRGEVVLYKDDYIKGWFHASAGGFTTSAKVGLAYAESEPPYIKSIKSPDDQAPEDVQNWQVVFSQADIIEALKKIGKDFEEISQIEIVSKDNTGRAIEIKFAGSNREAIVKSANFRSQLGSKDLKSIKISSLDKVEEGFRFKGEGFGHGVGLSQWGAFALAKEGKSSEDIIRYYFEDIEIAKEYD